MKLVLGLASALSVGLVILLANAPPARAATLILPYGTSESAFSLTTPVPGNLTVAPVVLVTNTGCSGASCPSSFWDVGVTVDFFNQADNLLASTTGTVSESCTPSNCSVPTPESFSIPIDSASFEIINDVSVGGGWSFASASEFVSTGVPLSETPIPAALPLSATGFAILGLLGWRRRPRGLRARWNSAAVEYENMRPMVASCQSLDS